MELKISSATLEKHIASGAISEPLPNMRSAAYEAADVLAAKIEQYGLKFLMEKDVRVQLQQGSGGPQLMLAEPTPMVAARHAQGMEPVATVMEKVKQYGLQTMIQEGMVDVNIGLKDKPEIPLTNLSARNIRIN